MNRQLLERTLQQRVDTLVFAWFVRQQLVLGTLTVVQTLSIAASPVCDVSLAYFGTIPEIGLIKSWHKSQCIQYSSDRRMLMKIIFFSHNKMFIFCAFLTDAKAKMIPNRRLFKYVRAYLAGGLGWEDRTNVMEILKYLYPAWGCISVTSWFHIQCCGLGLVCPIRWKSIVYRDHLEHVFMCICFILRESERVSPQTLMMHFKFS